MKRRLLLALVLTLVVGACTDDRPPISAPPPSRPTKSPDDQRAERIQIYSAVIRRLVTKDHTFGGGPTPFKYVYVVNGSIEEADDPMGGTLFGPAPRPFPHQVVDGIRARLQDLPPIRFIIDGGDVRRGKHGMGGVKNDGVIISLGAVERKKRGAIHVSNGLWCGGLCGQWLTYVLHEQQGRWKITGTTGPYVIS
jgi:hypothetical protein